jgi:hypothetical protein
MAMKKENKKLLMGVLGTVLVLGVLVGGFFGGKAAGWWGTNESDNNPLTQPVPVININNPAPQQGNSAPGLIYVDLYGNLMDKAKFVTDSSNAYAGIEAQSVKFYDLTKNPQNDPRTNVLAVPDFQIVADSTTDGLLSGTKKGIAGHTYVYYFENTTGTYYDVTGTFTIPSNVNAFAPAFDFGNVLAPKVGTIGIYNESGKITSTATYIHSNMSIQSTTGSTDVRVQVGSQTYSDFVRIWGEYSDTTIKSQVVGVSAVQKAGPSTGVTIDSSDAVNPIITINELTAQYPLTFTYYFQGSASVGTGYYMVYVDDWNAVPGKFGAKVDAPIGLV